METLNGMLLLYSDRGGKKWIEKARLNIPVPSYTDYSATPYFLDKQRGVLLFELFDSSGARLIILRTDDGGKNWNKIRTPLKKNPWHFSEVFEGGGE